MRDVKVMNDKIRGSLMAGAAGDALGYEVEFKRLREIVSIYGERGITTFKLDRSGIAQISDDTQMTLFTANGMLMGLTRGYTRGIGGRPEFYVEYAYRDWYYTQVLKPADEVFNHTWLSHLPEMAHRRAPGITCLEACESLIRAEPVVNHSKGCGGVMRVAPMALLMAGYMARKGCMCYTLEELAEAGGTIAEVTHKHPLGFLPAALLTTFIFNLALLPTHQAVEDIARIARESLDILDTIYLDKDYGRYKRTLRALSERAIELAESGVADREAIRSLGEGWTAEEAWAIALYCAIRHADSLEEAIIASVNHDGDSDSTGSITGNIMGVIYGYEYIKQHNIFCPEGHSFEQTIELSDIILALADDLTTSCVIGEITPIDTYEQRRWELRYCNMLPVGLGRIPDEEQYFRPCR